MIGCDPANAGTEPPQELLDAYANGGTWGSLDFGTAQTEGGQRASDMESALDGFSEGDFIDAQIRVTNAMFGAFTISQECPWQ